MRHVTLLRSAPMADEPWRPLLLWIEASSMELARARSGLLRNPAVPQQERTLADEFLSTREWIVLTDCERALLDARRAMKDRADPLLLQFDAIEVAIGSALQEEIAYRRSAQFDMPEPSTTAQLEQLLARMRWLKKHFERVLFLDVHSYEIVNRFGGWLSAITAALAYTWFFLWRLALDRHPIALGSGIVVLVLAAAVAAAGRDRFKEAAQTWLAGRVQRMYAQRVTRYRLPSKERPRAGAVVVSARESFSQSSAERPDPVYPGHDVTHDVTVLRFTHHATVARPPATDVRTARHVRFTFRLDLSPIFPRLHDAVRGLASLDRRTGRVTIVDVPRNYELPLHATLQSDDVHIHEEVTYTVVLNKNGIVRVEKVV
jgi:hypothetical protein